MVQSLEKTKLLHNHICISPSTEQAYFNRNMRKLIVLSLSTSRGRLVTPTTQLYMVGTENTYYFTVSTQLVYRSSSAYNSFFLVVTRPNRHYLTTKSDYSR